MTRILDLAVKLAVRKGAGAAFAKLDIGFRVEHAFAPQAPGIFRALAHHLAALQDDGAKAHLRQQQAREDTARARPDHQRALKIGLVRRVGDEFIIHVGHGLDVGIARETLQQAGFILHRHIQRVDAGDRLLVARVVGALEDPEIAQLRRRQFQPLEQRGLQRFRRVAKRQFELGEADHDRWESGTALIDRTVPDFTKNFDAGCVLTAPLRRRRLLPCREGAMTRAAVTVFLCAPTAMGIANLRIRLVTGCEHAKQSRDPIHRSLAA
jgi:hypothetical protein